MTDADRIDQAERLVEAAGDMLEALKAVVGPGYLEDRPTRYCNPSQDYVSKAAIAMVRAAIAKAEGQFMRGDYAELDTSQPKPLGWDKPALRH